MQRRLVSILLAAVCISPVVLAAEWPTPTVVAPIAVHADPPSATLPAHAKRIGAVAFNMDALRPPAATQHKSEFDNNSSFSSPFGGYKGPGFRFSTHFFSSQWFRVRACNAAGCGAWATTHIPATGPNCEIPPV